MKKTTLKVVVPAPLLEHPRLRKRLVNLNMELTEILCREIGVKTHWRRAWHFLIVSFVISISVAQRMTSMMIHAFIYVISDSFVSITLSDARMLSQILGGMKMHRSSIAAATQCAQSVPR